MENHKDNDRATLGGCSSAAPCSVERTTRDVIEHKLLAALDDENKVAILATRDDLETMILGLRGVVAESGRRSYAQDLADGMEQLLCEAFPPNDKLTALPPDSDGGASEKESNGK